jgi:hypothetical protein
MAQSPGHGGGVARQRSGRQPECAAGIVVVTSHVCRMVDRYIAAQRTMLARFPEYGNATGRAAFGARLDQLEALVRDAAAGADTAARS